MSPSDTENMGFSQEYVTLRDQHNALQWQFQRLLVLQAISQELVSELDHDRLLSNILRSAVTVMDGSAGALYLLDELTDELIFAVVEGGGGERLQGRRMSRHQGIAGWALNHKEAVIVDDTLQDKRFYAAPGKSVGYTTTSIICAPLLDRGKAIGVLQILNQQSGERFDESDKELLIALAAQSAVAIRNAQLYQNLREERDRLVALEEDVRKRLARDLHDGPTQFVAALSMNLEFIRALLKRDPDKVNAELDEASELAERAMRGLRTMLFDLRPVVLETKGLAPALETYSAHLAETEGLRVHLVADPDTPRLSKQAESAVFAVVQEAVGNARKHTQAENIWITVRRQEETLDVTVRDDGQGFDVREKLANYESSGSMGMINMRERAEMIQGRFSLDSTVGQGTTVSLVVPLASNLRT